MLSGAAGAVSDQMTIVTAATNHNTRHPMITAGLARTMQSLTGGRFVLGLGRGIPVIQDTYGIGRITTAELEDFAGIMRRLFRGEAIIGHEGPAGSYPVLYLAAMDEELPLGLVAFGPHSLEPRWPRLRPGHPAHLLHRGDDPALRGHGQGRRPAGRPGSLPRSRCGRASPPSVTTSPRTGRLMKSVGRLATYLQGYGDLIVTTNGWDPAVLERFRADPVVSGFLGGIDSNATDRAARAHRHPHPREWLAASATGTGRTVCRRRPGAVGHGVRRRDHARRHADRAGADRGCLPRRSSRFSCRPLTGLRWPGSDHSAPPGPDGSVSLRRQTAPLPCPPPRLPACPLFRRCSGCRRIGPPPPAGTAGARRPGRPGVW